MAISAREVMAIKNRIKPLPLPEPFKTFFGRVPENSAWKCIVYGLPGGGKSTFLLQFADVLTRFGGVLYGNLEESVPRGTLQEKLKLVSVSSNVMFLEKSNMDEFYKELDTGKYKYCIVDSISEFAKTPKQYKAFKDRIEQYENITFFYILHATKTGLNYKGPSELSHDTDIVLAVNNFEVCPDKNRLQGSEKKYVYNILKRSIREKDNGNKNDNKIKSSKKG